MINVVCIGECMIELRPQADGSYALGFAGDVFNTAVYLKRSAPGFTVRFLTATGVDRFSREMRAAWRAEGIEDDLVFALEGTVPGLYAITVDAEGERSFTYWRSASPARRWLELLMRDGGAERLAGADLVYLSGISLAILPEEQRGSALQLLSDLRRRSTKVGFDPNYRSALWPSAEAARQVLNEAMRIADIVFPSLDDLIAAGLEPPAGRECITTCGADGCRIDAQGAEIALQAPP